MLFKTLTSRLKQHYFQVPLRLVLSIPFVLQTLGIVGITGYLSLRNGRRVMTDLASQLSGKIAVNLEQEVQTYLKSAPGLNQVSLDAQRTQIINFSNFQVLQQYFWVQIRSSNSVSLIRFINKNRQFITIRKRDNNLPVVEIKDQSTLGKVNTYTLDNFGNRNTLISSINDAAGLPPWYQAVAKAKKPIWSLIYQVNEHSLFTLTHATPIYTRTGEFLGGLGNDISLDQISDLLRQEKISESGKAFIIDRTGKLIANSSNESPFITSNGQQKRLSVMESSIPVMQATGKFLLNQFGKFSQIKNRETLSFELAGKTQIVQVSPIQDQFGLDWLMVVVIPTEDLMGQINSHIYNTIFICLGVLGLSIISGIFTSRLIIKPILQLSQATQAISRGELNQNIQGHGIKELEILATSFNLMSQQLGTTFSAWEQTNKDLETQIEQRTAALLHSEEKFFRAFVSSPNPITITSLNDGSHLEVNDAFCRMIGYTREEVIGHTSSELNLWVNPEARAQMFDMMTGNTAIRNYEFEFQTKSGEIKTGLLSTEIIYLNGQKCLLSLSNDISDRKRAEAALKQVAIAANTANRSKSEFLANMSHELRTPLNAILGFAQLMNRDPALSEEQKKTLAIISGSGEHLLELINDILDMSKIEAGRLTLNENGFDLYRLLDILEDMLQLKAKSKDLELIFEIASNVPHYIYADESKVRQVLINLLGNAIKFTETGGVVLRIFKQPLLDTINQPKNSPYRQPVNLFFEIEDTGPGIAPSELNLLFEPFVQTETGRKSQTGTGLGLPISRKFVEMMGGEISVSSTLDRGTIFKFNVQVSLADPQEIHYGQSTGKVLKLAPDQPSYRILVVEDRFESRLLLVRLLSTIGFEVKEAENGAVAVEIWSEWEPHLIWMDMRMSVMDGYEATKQIKAHLKGQATVIIALTASALDEDRSIVMSAGCDDFVRKPFREEVLLAKMAEYLGVVYIYEDSTVKNHVSKVKNEENNGKIDLNFQLSKMPDEWLERLHTAAIKGYDELILQLGTEIPPEYTLLADTLADWSNNFRFDKIINLIQNYRQ